MSAFVVILDRHRRTLSRCLPERRPLERLRTGRSRRPDADSARRGATPDGRRSRLEVVFDGRLDNRVQLLDDLGLEGDVADSELALAAFRKWGRRCFERLLGPFAMIVSDAERQFLVAGRDALGDRTLCYHHGAERLILGSEASVLLEDPAVSARLDETTLSHFFAAEAPAAGATFFADVRELPPGHRLCYEDGRLEVERYWRPEDLPQVRYRTDGEYVEHFRSLLIESVRCRMPEAGPPAVLMSGGLDSTSVAAVAATEVAAADPGARLPVISWIFDELPGADERRFMDPMVERFSLSAQRIRGDGEWPLRDLETWPVSRSAPWQGLYCRLQNRAYKVARDAGSTVLLTGEFGDHLFLGQEDWLRDLLAERRWAEAWRGLRDELQGRSPWRLARAGPARGALARALGWPGRRAARHHWLTPHARRLLEANGGRRRRLPGVLDPRGAHAVSLELPNASRAGIDVRRPYRDRRLIELVLSIPAHMLYRPGWPKWILRQATEGLLPESVRLRRQPSTLLPLAARGLVERELDRVRELLASPEAVWRRFVRSEWLEKVFPRRLCQGRDGLEAVVPWQCVCLELWLTRSGHSAS